jgi:nucleoid-associated protein EbfC
VHEIDGRDDRSRPDGCRNDPDPNERGPAKGRILGVSIDDSLMKPEEKQMVEDLVAAAFNDARGKADRASAEEMQRIQSGIGLPPGFNLPGMG